jgi:tRNA pseudouridine55 synthase
MISGILLLNKPSGISSNQALQKAKKILKVSKAGHFGTLDPLAEGLLIIGINSGTKLSKFLLNDEKEYEATIRLGISTDTDDSEGKVITADDTQISIETLLGALDQFRGEQTQIPPKYSAIKIQGRKLYDYARKGEEIDIQPRKVTIHFLEVLEFEYPILHIKLRVSKGTYIRSIARDLGLKLGVGAHLTKLVRTGQGDFRLLNATTFENLNEQNILDLDKVFSEISCIEISSSQLKDLEHGRRPNFNHSCKGLVILKHANKIAGLARIDNRELIKEFLV